MNEDQLRQFLKYNLDISLKEDSPYWETESDYKRITVELRLCGELISADSVTI